MSVRKNFQFLGYVVILSMLAALITLIVGCHLLVNPLAILSFVALALYSMGHPILKGFSFTFWVFAFVVASMFYPSAFGTWFGFDLKNLIVPLIQIITFGMGSTLSTKDFKRVFVMPWPVFIGIFMQFTIMPLVGYSIAMTFGFSPEVAAGIILIGSVSSGVASNVITYLASGNVPLSVTITACTTLLSPFVTPFWMKILAGKLIQVDIIAMMFSIFNMIIIPIVAGLIANKILYSQKKRSDKSKPLVLVSVLTIVLAVAALFLPKDFLGPLATLKPGIFIGFVLISLVALAKLLVSNLLKGPENWMDKALPAVSMFSICVIIAIITARSRDQLLTVGVMLIFAAILHNATGYFLGYWGAKLARLDESACRTVAIEVGMQNGGMATGIAMDVLKSASAALAPAIFGPWMNISGSVLATFWRHKPVQKP